MADQPNEATVLNHIQKLVGEERMKNIHFLMDFEGATSAGDVEDVGPPPADTAE